MVSGLCSENLNAPELSLDSVEYMYSISTSQLHGKCLSKVEEVKSTFLERLSVDRNYVRSRLATVLVRQCGTNGQTDFSAKKRSFLFLRYSAPRNNNDPYKTKIRILRHSLRPQNVLKTRTLDFIS